MPRSSKSWAGSEALWITVAGWAAAAERTYGSAWVITSDRLATPREVASFPVRSAFGASGRSLMRFLPTSLTTLLKDIVLWRNRNRKTYHNAPWQNAEVSFVWEQHDLFSGPGKRLAKQLKVPFILYVHAPVIWEAARWGVKRPLWGRVIEHFFESASLKKADLVACVSEEVATRVKQMGVSPSKLIVSPMGVDAVRFTTAKGDNSIRQKLELKKKFIIGWAGSFRGFHGLDDLVRSFCKVVQLKPEACLLLVGDGAERPAIEKLVAQLGLQHHVVFAGRVPFEMIPAYVASFDVAVVSAARADHFHYSPLKLREYLAAQCAVLAPRAGEVPRLFEDEKELLLYTLGNENEMSEKMLKLINDTSLRKRIAEAGCRRVMEMGTWDHELRKILNQLNA